MATPLATLLHDLRTDEAVRAQFEDSPLEFMGEHGWTELEPADLEEAMLILADGAPTTEAQTWIAAGHAAGDHETTADALAAAMASFTADQAGADPAHLDGGDDDAGDDAELEITDLNEHDLDERDLDEQEGDRAEQASERVADADIDDHGHDRAVTAASVDADLHGLDGGDEAHHGFDLDAGPGPAGETSADFASEGAGEHRPAFEAGLPDVGAGEPDPGAIGDGWEDVI